MITAIATFLMNRGLIEAGAYKWAKRIVAALLLIVVIVPVALVWRACKPSVKLNEPQIKKAQDAIAKGERNEMIEVLAESDTAEDAIDSSLGQIEADKEAAKKNYEGWATDEMAAELEKRAKE